MKNKKLDEIRPARTGVKLKRRAPEPPPQPKPKGKPRILQGVAPVMAKLPPPTEEAAAILGTAVKAREALFDAIRHVNRVLMASKVLPENRSLEQENAEKEGVRALVDAATALEEASPGEGFLGMATLAVRQGLSLRDAGNRLAHQVENLRKEIEDLKRRLPSDETKSG
jgi:hypothetical protein